MKNLDPDAVMLNPHAFEFWCAPGWSAAAYSDDGDVLITATGEIVAYHGAWVGGYYVRGLADWIAAGHVRRVSRFPVYTVGGDE